MRRPHWVSSPKIRFFVDVRSRTRCMRRLSRSRSARSSSDAIHSSGTRSRRHSSASTRASTRSVLHASGAISRTLRACAIWTRQPTAASWSRTQIAPLIISTHACTSVPTRSTSRASPSSSAAKGTLVDDLAARAERAPSRASIRPVDPDMQRRWLRDSRHSLRHGRLLLFGCGAPRGVQPRGSLHTPRRAGDPTEYPLPAGHHHPHDNPWVVSLW
jgi:hypothetical protein